jgi:hypothetical protein
MKKNVSSVDRLIRIILGLVIAILGVYFNSWWGLIGLVLLATGLLKFCPIYSLLKISTQGKAE